MEPAKGSPWRKELHVPGPAGGTSESIRSIPPTQQQPLPHASLALAPQEMLILQVLTLKRPLPTVLPGTNQKCAHVCLALQDMP